MQAHEAKETDSAGLVANMYLPLAEKLMEKYFSENTVDAEAGMGTSVHVGANIEFERFIVVYLWSRDSSVSHGAGQEREYKEETGSSEWICRYVKLQLLLLIANIRVG